MLNDFSSFKLNSKQSSDTGLCSASLHCSVRLRSALRWTSA